MGHFSHGQLCVRIYRHMQSVLKELGPAFQIFHGGQCMPSQSNTTDIFGALMVTGEERAKLQELEKSWVIQNNTCQQIDWRTSENTAD